MHEEVVTGVEVANWVMDMDDMDTVTAGQPVELVQDAPFVLL